MHGIFFFVCCSLLTLELKTLLRSLSLSPSLSLPLSPSLPQHTSIKTREKKARETIINTF